MAGGIKLKKIKVAALQLKGLGENKEENINYAIRMVNEALKNKPDIICLPELFSTYYFCDGKNPSPVNLAETIPGKTTDMIAEIAKREKIWIICPIYEKDNSYYYNSASLINPEGKIAGKYRKAHLPHVDFGNVKLDETKYFSYGNLGFPVFEANGIKIGILICYDRSFPEAWRELSLGGADIVFVPTAGPGWRGEHWIMELSTMALQNGVFVVASNRVGQQDNIYFFGQTAIITPFGAVISRGDEQNEGIIYGELDLNEIKKARERLPLLNTRRPEVYALTSKGYCDNIFRDLISSFKNRGLMYLYILKSLESEFGRERAESLMGRGIYNRGIEVAKSYSKEAQAGELNVLAQDFMKKAAGRGEVFKPEIEDVSSTRCIIRMYSCPLVDCWKESGLSAEDVAGLCRIANRVDFGTFESMGYSLEISHSLAKGDGYCRLVITKE